MSNEEAACLLLYVGDPHEAVIASECRAGALTAVLYAYAGIWVDYIFPRRSANPARLKDLVWEKFGQHHYTALREVYSAGRSFSQLIETCSKAAEDDTSAQLLMDSHKNLKDFWISLGTAIDNLALCLEAAPCINMAPGSGSKWIQKKYPKLDYAYDRRTQLVHNAAIPLYFDAGLIVMNKNIFDMKYTDWGVKIDRPVAVDEYHRDWWPSIITDLTNLWERLRGWLRNKDLSRPRIDEQQVLTFCNSPGVFSPTKMTDFLGGNMPPSGTGPVKPGFFIFETDS